jgi:hypothetical protein
MGGTTLRRSAHHRRTPPPHAGKFGGAAHYRAMTLVDIEQIRDQRLVALFEFWHDRLDGRRMPRPDDLDPAAMARWADHLMLIDVPATSWTFASAGSARRWRPCSGRRAPAPASKP